MLKDKYSITEVDINDDLLQCGLNSFDLLLCVESIFQLLRIEDYNLYYLNEINTIKKIEALVKSKLKDENNE